MNYIERFKKNRKYKIGGILKFQNSGVMPARNQDDLFNSIYNINSKVHNKNTFSKAYPMIEQIYNKLIGYGLSSEEASGIMGNMLAENATFNPDLMNGSYKGLVQLSKLLQNHVTNTYGDMSLDNQLKFIADWAKGIPYKIDPSNVGYGYKQYSAKRGTTSREHAKAWSDWFERHGGSSDLRQKYADAFYNYFNQ